MPTRPHARPHIRTPIRPHTHMLACSCLRACLHTRTRRAPRPPCSRRTRACKNARTPAHMSQHPRPRRAPRPLCSRRTRARRASCLPRPRATARCGCGTCAWRGACAGGPRAHAARHTCADNGCWSTLHQAASGQGEAGSCKGSSCHTEINSYCKRAMRAAAASSQRGPVLLPPCAGVCARSAATTTPRSRSAPRSVHA